jgi:hypothetical protein
MLAPGFWILGAALTAATGDLAAGEVPVESAA